MIFHLLFLKTPEEGKYICIVAGAKRKCVLVGEERSTQNIRQLG